VETIREPLLVLTPDLRVITADCSFYDRFHVTAEETEGRFVCSIGSHAWDIPSLQELLEEIIPQNAYFNDFEVIPEFINFLDKSKIAYIQRRERHKRKGGKRKCNTV